MATSQSVIKSFMSTLDKTTLSGSAALDKAISSSSNFINTTAVIKQMIADCKSYNEADSKNGLEKFLLEKCGIILNNNTDTGAITGKDAGGSKTNKTSESVVPESGSLDKTFDK